MTIGRLFRCILELEDLIECASYSPMETTLGPLPFARPEYDKSPPSSKAITLVSALKEFSMPHHDKSFTLVRVVAPHFVAGFETDGQVRRAAPIIGYMVGWTDDRARRYIENRGWKASIVAT